jgi:hypothetical protein
MTELNLQIIFEDQSQFMNIDKLSSFKFMCNMIRSIFLKDKPQINNHKLVIFNGIPPKKICEHDIDNKTTLEQLKILNNSIIRVGMDEENYFLADKEIQPDNIELQREELKKYENLDVDKKEKHDFFDNSRKFVDHERENSSNEVKKISKNI